MSLPIEPHLDAVRNALRTHNQLILQAPPGAGKTTAVPLSLLQEPWLEDRLIVMLEPRRLAARMAAERMARVLGERLGERVGYQIRNEGKRSARTRILVVTEGILTRMLQSDPSLEAIACVMFDEFHERSLHSDLVLALSLESQSILREDLRLVVMSATLGLEALGALLPKAAQIVSQGRAFDVALSYLDPKVPQLTLRDLSEHIAKMLGRVLAAHEGDVLIFVPGAAEIHATLARLSAAYPDLALFALHGALDKQTQEAALCASKQRKVIVSTNIAQTSLTIEGVRIVIDSGMERQAYYDPSSGMDTLRDGFISIQSAIQRAGRAGRQSSGVCYRLWHEHKSLVAQSEPEILRADLSAFVLELAQWGVGDPSLLSLIDQPSSFMIKEARGLLEELQMLEPSGAIAPLGARSIALGVHPRLSYMLLRGEALGLAYEASLLSAMLSEADGLGRFGVDIVARLEALHERRFEPQERMGAMRVIESAAGLRARLGTIEVPRVMRFEMIGVLLALAYPDRIAMRREGGEYLLSSGKGASLEATSALGCSTFLAVASLGGSGKRIALAAPLSLEQIERYCAHLLRDETFCTFNPQSGRVESRGQKRLLALTLSSRPLAKPEGVLVTQALCAGIVEAGLEVLPWCNQSRALLHRVRFVRAQTGDEAWPDWSDAALLEGVVAWLGPYVEGMEALRELSKLSMEAILSGMLSYERRTELDRLAPHALRVPSGSMIAIDYSDSAQAVLCVRLQEMFGLEQTPRILEGRHPLLLHLLSPAHRSMQVTFDLASFWRGAYHEVKKELRGKYKKHYWPDDPLEAQATSRTKKFLSPR
ncbi:MAG: ATP-dependent helicase HrpB [Campylobacterales bacterium]|nr:ATP-dependent helicase HrpB [Campylobacterales bacterium]